MPVIHASLHADPCTLPPMLADLAGIHRTYVGDVERGERNISLLKMSRLSKALGVRLSQIVLEMERYVGR